MRIGMILDQHFPPDPRVENEAKQLVKKNHEVFLFSFSRENSHDTKNIDGIEVCWYKQSWLVYKLSALVYTFPFYKWLVSPKVKKFIENTRPDVLHVHDMIIAEAVFQANDEFHLPIILDLHENRPEIMKMYKHVNQFPGNLLIDLNKWNKKQFELIDKSDYTIVVTDYAKREILRNSEILPDSIIVVPNTIDKDNFYQHSLNRDIIDQMSDYFNILYVGDTSLRRGTDTAIKAVELLKDKIPHLRFTMVGNSSQDNELSKLVETLNLSSYIRFEGWKNIALFPSYIAGSDVCLSPLKRNLHHDTTFANKIFQYMAIGKPIIVSDCPAQADLVAKEKCGLVHEAGNEQDLASKILQLYQDKDLRESMGTRGKKAIENKYHWDSTGKTLVDLYERLDRNQS